MENEGSESLPNKDITSSSRDRRVPHSLCLSRPRVPDTSMPRLTGVNSIKKPERVNGYLSQINPIFVGATLKCVSGTRCHVITCLFVFKRMKERRSATPLTCLF